MRRAWNRGYLGAQQHTSCETLIALIAPINLQKNFIVPKGFLLGKAIGLLLPVNTPYSQPVPVTLCLAWIGQLVTMRFESLPSEGLGRKGGPYIFVLYCI